MTDKALVQQQTQAIANRHLFAELKPGDRIALKHEVKVGSRIWMSETTGTVVSTERRRHGLHFRRSPDDKVFSDLIVLKRDSGELTTLSIDEYSALRRA
jgi:hypothetical protein